MYQLLGVLANNVGNTIYKARQRTPDRLVALKVLSAGCNADPVAVARLCREARRMAACAHPGVVRAYDFATFKGRRCLAMEFIDGEALAKKLNAPNSPCEAARIVICLAEATAQVHKQGLAHCGIAAEHILMSSDGVPKLGGFGASRALGVDPAATIVNDLQGLGTVFYQLLTAPLSSPCKDVVFPTLLDSRAIPEQVKAVCMRCFSGTGVQPYATAPELVLALREIGVGKVTS